MMMAGWTMVGIDLSMTATTGEMGETGEMEIGTVALGPQDRISVANLDLTMWGMESIRGRGPHPTDLIPWEDTEREAGSLGGGLVTKGAANPTTKGEGNDGGMKAAMITHPQATEVTPT